MEEVWEVERSCTRRTTKPINCIVSNWTNVVVECLEGILARNDKWDFLVHVVAIFDHKTSLSDGFLDEFKFLPTTAQGRWIQCKNLLKIPYSSMNKFGGFWRTAWSKIIFLDEKGPEATCGCIQQDTSTIASSTYHHNIIGWISFQLLEMVFSFLEWFDWGWRFLIILAHDICR